MKWFAHINKHPQNILMQVQRIWLSFFYFSPRFKKIHFSAVSQALGKIPQSKTGSKRISTEKTEFALFCEVDTGLYFQLQIS